MKLIIILTTIVFISACNNGTGNHSPKKRTAVRGTPHTEATAQPQTPSDGGGAGNQGGGPELTTAETAAQPNESFDFEYHTATNGDSSDLPQSKNLQQLSAFWANTNTTQQYLIDEEFYSPEKEYFLFSPEHSIDSDSYVYLYISPEVPMGVRHASLVTLKKQPSQLTEEDKELLTSAKNMLFISSGTANSPLKVSFYNYDVTVLSAYNQSLLTTTADSIQILMRNDIKFLKGKGILLKRSYQKEMGGDSEEATDVQYFAFFPFSNVVRE